tara:strand:- start:5044 stop:5334 length:291 start_codon:yes stop_codon:yes gene_type:complete
MSTSYNGWTNYATWRVNLEIFDGIDPREMGWHKLDLYDLADTLQEYAAEVVTMGASGLALDYAIAFMADVNFREIANSIVEGYEDERDFEDESENA